MNWHEFKPSIFFLLKFLGLYVTGSLLYGWFVTFYYPKPDPITIEVTHETAWLLTRLGWHSTLAEFDRPTVPIVHEARPIVSVFEGCNGMNVIVIFVSFLLAFGPRTKTTFWFAALGIVVVHASNLVRIGSLFLVALNYPKYLYLAHKYLFTASIYGIVLILWFIWIRVFSKPVRS